MTLVHIRKVEIFGFKSFGFKNTIVNFQPGLVSISGPNGSGKSNILDAIMFALGENRPKTMRVDKLKSLIHDIEGTRRGPKMIRTSVQFENSDRTIPVDSDTVDITREMDDKGENIYYLNKKKTNRSQILDLLEVANAGLNALNVVQQGTVTRISEFSPEEKRVAIENLIGLAFFDEKKSEAIKQLDAADRRLEVALARMDEIKKRIDELEEERNLKLRHDLLEREINRFNAISASNKLKEINSDKTSKERNLNAITSEIKKFDEERVEIKKQIHEIDNQKSKFLEEANAYNQSKSSIESELSEAMRTNEEAKSGLATSQKRIQHIEERLPELEKEIEETHQQRSSIESQSIQLKESIETTNVEKKKIHVELTLLDSERKKVLTQQAHVSAEKLDVDNKIKNLTRKLNEAKLILAKLESEKIDAENKINANFTKNNQVGNDTNKLSDLKHRLESVTENHKATITELKSRIFNLNTKRTKMETDLEELNLILEKSTKAATQYESKIRIVEEIMHEDYSIAKLKEDAHKLGIEGLVYQVISWDKQYERAMLAASSDWIKAFVVKDFATLLSLAQVARAKKLPKLKIIPIDAIPNYKMDLPNEKGVVGSLSDYVKCDTKFSPIKTFLFGNVILVDSIESALRISKSGYKTVTLEGEFFEAKASAVVVDINSKISKLTKIISMSSSVEGLQLAISLLKGVVHKKKMTLKKIDNTLQNYKDRLSISETGLATTSHSFSDLKLKVVGFSKLQNGLSTRISQLSRKKERMKTEAAKQESYVSSLNERISIVEDNYAEGEQTRVSHELERLNEKKASLESQQTQIMSKFRDISTQLATFGAEETQEKSHMKNLHEENSSLKAEKHELDIRIRSLEKEKETSDEQLVNLREKEQQLISTSGTSVSVINEFDDKLKDLNGSERSLTKQINTLERQSDSLTRDLKDLTKKETDIKKMLGTYGYDENLVTFDIEPILQALFKEQRSMTSLNAKAPETYLEISSGYRSMSTRKNSLEEERNSIVRFIEEIEKDKRQTFLDAFDIVDKEIRHIFTKMTGGNAWLELQNEDDIFSSGISYLIQFPNKPKRESTSISGGEKTLAAIVFVLAIQKLKPSPFYLFDEIDASLDAPNSERLAKILEERSRESQFLMVSLKDSVVQKAKLIYGVYPKNGVSHVVIYKDKRLPLMTP